MSLRTTLLIILNIGLASDCIGVFKSIILHNPMLAFTNTILFASGLFLIGLVKQRL